jgi:hypothetical protein
MQEYTSLVTHTKFLDEDGHHCFRIGKVQEGLLELLL